MSRPKPAGRPPDGRGGVPFGVGVAAVLLLGVEADNASAAALGGVATSLGLLAALSAIVVMNAWQAHQLVGSLSTLGGLLALAAAAALLWRFSAMPGVRRQAASLAPATIGREIVDRSAVTDQVALPADVDRRCLMADLRQTFLALQIAWDQGAWDELGDMTTSEMLDELCAARSAGYGATNRSEVITLDVRLVAFEETEAAQLVCVEFSGMIRQSVTPAADPFREFWMLTRAKGDTARWKLARHQALW